MYIIIGGTSDIAQKIIKNLFIMMILYLHIDQKINLNL